MTKQIINIGALINDGTGDTLRSGAIKINENFTELYDLANASSQVTHTNNVISTLLDNQDLVLDPNGAGTTRIVGATTFYPNALSDTPVLSLSTSGRIRATIASLASTSSAFQLIGNTAGSFVSPQNVGVMQQITGQNTYPSRIYNDGSANYSAYIGRRYNGEESSPTALTAGQIITRVGATPYTSTGWPSISTARIDFVTTEDQTGLGRGNAINFYSVPNGSILPELTLSVDSDNITSATSILPATDNTLDLGSAQRRWRDIYIGPGNLFITDGVTNQLSGISVNSGVLQIDNANQLQVGNIRLTSTGISTTTPSANITLGEPGDTGYIQFYRGLEFSDATRQTTAGIPLSEKGQAFGVASLGIDGKVDPLQLPSGAVIYRGTWNALSNVPLLGPGLPLNVQAGWEYSVQTAGTQDLGGIAGTETFLVGDYVRYNGTGWDKILGSSSQVTSFNSRTGSIALSTIDVMTVLLPNSLANSLLVHSNFTISTGAGLSGGGLVALGSTITLTNTGVISVIAGTHLSVNNASGAVTISTNATSAATVSTLVSRDTSGNFSAGTITATLAGNASTATKLASTKTINGVAFDGSANITVTADANTLTNTTLNSTVVSSSLTSVGLLTQLDVAGAIRYDQSQNNGTVTQLTSKVTPVTCNGRTGQITTSATTLNKGAAIKFTVSNSTITSAKDIVIVNIVSGATVPYSVSVNNVNAAGSFDIALANADGTSAGSNAADTLVISFAVIKVS